MLHLPPTPARNGLRRALPTEPGVRVLLTWVSRAEGWVSVASALETEPTPPWSDMSSRVIGVGFSGAA